MAEIVTSGALTQAKFYHGDPIMADYTPTAAVAAGDVIEPDGSVLLLIAHNATGAGTLGAASLGGGVYNMSCGSIVTMGNPVWWDHAASQCTSTSGTLFQIGFALETTTDAGTALIWHHPVQTTAGAE